MAIALGSQIHLGSCSRDQPLAWMSYALQGHHWPGTQAGLVSTIIMQRYVLVLIKPRRSRAGDAGSNAFRISIEWARIVPQRGVIDEEAVKHYHRMFDQIDSCALSPAAALYHDVLWMLLNMKLMHYVWSNCT